MCREEEVARSWGSRRKKKRRKRRLKKSRSLARICSSRASLSRRRGRRRRRRRVETKGKVHVEEEEELIRSVFGFSKGLMFLMCILDGIWLYECCWLSGFVSMLGIFLRCEGTSPWFPFSFVIVALCSAFRFDSILF